MSTDGSRTADEKRRTETPRSPGSTVRTVLLAVLVVTTLVLAGCVGNREYTTSIGEPTTGKIIDNVSINEVTPITGARLTVHHSADHDDFRSYSLGVYIRENGSFELHKVQSFDEDVNSTGITLLIPSRDETVADQQIRVEHRENETVVDAVNVTVRREG